MVYGNRRIHATVRKLLVGFILLMLLSTLATANAASPQSPGRPDIKIPAGARIVGRDIVYPNGVMVSIDAGTGLLSPNMNPDSASTASVIACSSGYVCLYEHVDYGGRRLQWSGAQDIDDLRDYGFNDQMSSWRNLGNKDARWYFEYDQTGTSRCMQPNTSVTTVGWGLFSDNDVASSMRIYANSTTC